MSAPTTGDRTPNPSEGPAGGQSDTHADIYIVLAAAGEGTRLAGGTRKANIEVAGRPLILWSLAALFCTERLLGGAFVVHGRDVERAEKEWLPLTQGHGIWSVRAGGDSRTESVFAGFQGAPPQARFLLVHDAARPLLDPRDLRRVIERARDSGAAILAAPVADTLKLVRNGRIEREIPRHELFGAQTPQVIRWDLLEESFRCWEKNHRNTGSTVTDEAGLLAAIGAEVEIVEARFPNPKVTFPADLALVEAILRSREDP